MKPISLVATFLIISGISITQGCDTPYSYYGTWDKNDNKVVVEKEFTRVFSDAEYFTNVDLDRSNAIDEDEWKEGIISYIPNYDFIDHGSFNDWDQNGDEVLNEEEFASGTFRLWDEDANGEIDEAEYEAWHYDVD